MHTRAPLERGQPLFHASEPADHLFVVRSGCVRTTLVTEDGDEQAIGFHPRGDIIGLARDLEPGKGVAVTAIEHTNGCMVALEPLRRLALRLARLQEQIHRLMGREIVRSHEHFVMMGRISASQRVALFLLSWSRRLLEAGFSSTDLPLSMAREDIANYLGVARETVSRAVSRLQEDGTIRPGTRCVEIRHRARLARAAGVAAATDAGEHVEEALRVPA